MRLLHTIVTLPFILLLIILSGCATTNQNRAQKAISSMDNVEEKLTEISEQLNQTESSLQDVANANEDNIEDAFNTFSDNVSDVQGLREDLSDLVEEMDDESDEYLSHWQKEAEAYDNENLRRGSAERRKEVRSAFEEVSDKSGDLSRTLDSYLSAAREIESYLRNDMTTKGIKAVYSLTEQVEDTGEEAQQAISEMQKAISDARDEVGAQKKE